MSSRYSRIFLRPKASGSLTTADGGVPSSPGYSYPPSTSHDYHSSSQAASPPPPAPHPYTLGASVFTQPSPEPSTTSHTHGQRIPSEFSEKNPETPLGHTYPRNTHIPLEQSQYGEPQRLSHPRQRNSRFMTDPALPLPAPLRLRPIFLLLLFLPIPPLLSLLYMITGHAILRHSSASSTSIYTAPLLSSIEAGATGGVILSLPLAILLYLLFFPSTSSSSPPAEDFFEDDDSTLLMRERAYRWMHYASLALCALLALCIGAIAGPLGVTCLVSGTAEGFVSTKKMLSVSAAGAAGIVGGVVLSFAVVLAGVAALLVWTRTLRTKKTSTGPATI